MVLAVDSLGSSLLFLGSLQLALILNDVVVILRLNPNFIVKLVLLFLLDSLEQILVRLVEQVVVKEHVLAAI